MNRMIIAGALFLVGCSTTGIASKSELRQIDAGMSKQDVVEILGQPGNRTFRDSAEALQYCRTGLMTDEYTTVWIQDGSVVGVTTQNADIASGLCSGRFPPVDWGQIPADVSIEVR